MIQTLLLFGALLTLFGYAGRRFFEPSRVMAGYWSLVLAACLLFVPHTFSSFSSLLLPGSCVLAFSLAAFIGNPRRSGRPAVSSVIGEPEPTPAYPARYQRLLDFSIVVGVAAGLAAAAVALPEGIAMEGGNLADAVASASNQTAVANYAGQLALGPAVSLALAFVYAVCLVAPAGFFLAKSWWRLGYVVLPVASALPYAIITTQKAVFLQASACVTGAWIGTYLVIRGRSPSLTMKSVLAVVAGASAVVIVFVLLGVLRLGSFSTENGQIAVDRIRSYVLFSLPAYTMWEDGSAIMTGPPTLGASSLAGVAELTGDTSESSFTKAYGDYVVLPGESQATNVYTMFRNTREDFGAAGQIVFYAIWGWFLAWCFRRALAGSATAAVPVAFTYCLVFMSVAQLMTIFFNVVLSFILALAFVSIGTKSIKLKSSHVSTPVAVQPLTGAITGRRPLPK